MPFSLTGSTQTAGHFFCAARHPAQMKGSRKEPCVPGKAFSRRKCRCAITEALYHNQWNSFWLWFAKRFMYFTFPEFALIIVDMETKLRILYSDRKQSWRNEQC